KSAYDCSAKILINVVDISNLGLCHPNGTQALITKIDDLKINNDITLYDVLVVPEYTIRALGTVTPWGPALTSWPALQYRGCEIDDGVGGQVDTPTPR
ncbi:hypothetical protein Tco_1471915, partial [Tanacetum coccineum]